MTISLYQASVPVFQRMLGNLASVLEKGAAYAVAKKIDPAVLINARLYPDMFPLSRQVQIATDHAKGAPARIAGIEVPKYEDTEASFDELQARIGKTQTFLKTFTPAQLDGREDADVTIPVGGVPRTFKALPYLLYSAMPNFYFHVTTAYDILRHGGVELGKRDFIGPV